jgi:uncharacterized membrane protein
LTVERLSNATYEDVIEGPLTLTDGLFEGEPFEEGAASRPIVKLVPGAMATGDLNGDGSEEAVVVLAHNSGGSGVFMYLAVMRKNGGKLDNVATIRLGDRVKVIAVDIDEGKVVAELVEHGPDDPMCCPASNAYREWLLRGNELISVEPEAGSRGTRISGHLVWGLVEVYEELTSTPYQSLFVEVRGDWVGAPTEGFGAEFDEALRITELIRAENEGFGCRLELSDVLFIASGNEPSWRLQIREDGISVRSMDAAGAIEFPAPRKHDEPPTIRFEAETAESAIRISLERRRCIDTMSGARYAWAATVDTGGRQFEGCAAEGA